MSNHDFNYKDMSSTNDNIFHEMGLEVRASNCERCAEFKDDIEKIRIRGVPWWLCRECRVIVELMK
jgi:hypothetical protein